ncbi:hypothetical protein [Micromonospora sp. SH-82]|uniref:hypothetical protein n=1 Tax=Micromonospora sp. SH-82 TaxID=3132938 RepID=UPI003EC12CC7
MTETTTASGVDHTESLLAAGAVLPADPGNAGDTAVPLTARTYRHPALGDRAVVRLVDSALGEGEDASVGFLGLEPAAPPVVVGLGPRRPLAFPEWVLVHHPDDGRHALTVLPELQRLTKQARSRPKAALDGYQGVADRFARTLPHVLPTFFEQAARVFLDAGQDTYATQLFNKARKAEAEHGLPIDLDRMDEVYVEFASATVVSASALAGYAKELSAGLPAAEALDRFCRLALRAAAAGVVPSIPSATAVNRLVRAAAKETGRADAVDREAAYLTALLRLPVTAEAPTGWWKAHRPAMTTLAGRDPAVRGALLDLMPTDRDTVSTWLALLADTGALTGLTEPDLPDVARPSDGSAGWLRRLLGRTNADGYHRIRVPALYPLVERMADRLRTELAATGTTLTADADLDLLDLLLGLGLPVAPPAENGALDLVRWFTVDGDRDLRAVAADDRFTGALRRGLDKLDDEPDVLRRIADTPGLLPVLTEWLRARIRDRFSSGLPHLPEAVDWLGRLPVEALRLVFGHLAPADGTAPDGGLEQALDLDLPDHVARSLRGGLVDELSWPDWERAWQEVTGGDPGVTLTWQEAWPYVVLAGPTTVRVLGAEGVVLRHDLRIPAGDLWGQPGYHYVDGHLLVFWRSRELGYDLRGYWHSAPGEPQLLTGDVHSTRRRRNSITLPLPGGGRITGEGVLHVGDTAVPAEAPVITDGTSHWVYRRDDSDRPDDADHGPGWREYDPAADTCGPRSLPRFLADLPADAHLVAAQSWLRPALSDRATPAAVPVQGLLGWRVSTLPDGSVRGEDLAGRTVTVPPGKQPIAALVLPGDDRPRAVLKGFALVDPDGTVSAVGATPSTRNYRRSPVPLPGHDFVGALLPRDPVGSAALRRVDRDTAAVLVAAALDERRAALAEEAARAALWATSPAGTVGSTTVRRAAPPGPSTSAPGAGSPAEEPGDALVDLVRRTMPEIGDEALLAGVAGAARLAAKACTDLEKVTAGLRRSASEPTVPATTAGPTDSEVGAALDGLRGTVRRTGGSSSTVTQLRLLATQRLGTGDGQAVRLHLDGVPLPAAPDWWSLADASAALAYRAVAAVTPQEHRDTLRSLLDELAGLDLVGPTGTARWRRFTLHLLDGDLTGPDGMRRYPRPGVLPLSGGAFVAVFAQSATSTGYRFEALFHDPTGRFAVPEPYTVVGSAPLGDERPDGWLERLHTEWAARGPLPWRPEAAERFADLTGVTPTAAKLVLAGLPHLDSGNTVAADLRKALDIGQAVEAKLAFEVLHEARPRLRRAVLSALVPPDPARLWTDGPDVAAAAAVWNDALGRRTAVPERLLAEAVRAVRTDWGPTRALPALLDPARSAELRTDLVFQVSGDRARPVDAGVAGFTGPVLHSTVALAAWVAHHTPAGDPARAALPAALGVLRDRLGNPDLLLDLGRYVSLGAFRQVAGTPSETGTGWERYGAIVLATHDDQPSPALRPVLLDAEGTDPYLPALRADASVPYPMEVALRLVRDPRFAALLDEPARPDPADPATDGSWWPQDPTRSVPDLVAEVAQVHGLGDDAAAAYLMLLAMPDPTDRDTATWTGWRPARAKAARAELARTDLVVEASRPRAGRTLFLPGPWLQRGSGQLPVESWKAPLFDLAPDGTAALGVTVPLEPVADLYRRAWRRVRDGDLPRFGDPTGRDARG